MNGNDKAGMVKLRNKYMEEQVEAQSEGRTIPPFQQWVESKKKKDKLASLSMQPSNVVR